MTNLKETIESMGLTVESVFVPFSQSRNKDKKYHSLNWKITLSVKGKAILTTDYGAGMGHCPSYSQKQTKCCELECENGFAYTNYPSPLKTKIPILPDSTDVIYSLLSDSDVLNHASFESWASDCGYDTDSRSAEKIYRDCLKIALALRAGLGDSNIAILQQAFQDAEY